MFIRRRGSVHFFSSHKAVAELRLVLSAAAGSLLHQRGKRHVLLVDSLSAVDIIVLFASAALGVAASCTDAWPLRSS